MHCCVTSHARCLSCYNLESACLLRGTNSMYKIQINFSFQKINKEVIQRNTHPFWYFQIRFSHLLTY